MEAIVLGAVGGILLVFGFIGRSRGIVNIVLSLVATLVAVIAAGVITSPVCNFLKEKTEVYDTVKEGVGEIVSQVDISSIEDVNKLELPDIITDAMVENVEKAAGSIAEYVTEYISDIVLTAIVFIVLFIIIFVILRVIISVADIIAKLPVIAQINQGAGFVAGLVYGIIVIWIGFIIITASSSMEWANDILVAINNNKVLAFIYDTNPIMNVLSGLIK